jgi:hypothetical protein
MGDEKKDEGARDPIKILLEEALEKQRNETEYTINHEYKNAMEITLHFINIKELKFVYRQNINKQARALVAYL